MARRDLVINLAAATPRVGIWCDRCLTSARYEVDVMHMADDGPRQLSTIARCNRCDDDD